MTVSKLDRTFRKRTMALSLILVLALLAAALPWPAFAAPGTVTCARTHIVRANDTTVRIAQIYKLKWRQIAEANNLSQPYNLTVGQSLCIPASSTAASTTTSGSSNVVSVTIAGGRIFIYASKFAEVNSFYVKVRDASTGVGGWHKLGNLRIGKNENLSKVFSVPDELESTVYLRVCLKNATTDALICRTAVNP